MSGRTRPPATDATRAPEPTAEPGTGTVVPSPTAAPTAAARPVSRTSRRTLLGAGAALGVTVPLLAAGALPAAADQTSAGLARDASSGSSSALAAYAFLQRVTDAYATEGPRLAQSYDDSRLKDIGFVYDNALTCLALLAAGDWTRARAIGDALLRVQDRDPAEDGRLRQAYHVAVPPTPGGEPAVGWEYDFGGTAVGDMAWTGIALAQLARRTKHPSYLAGLRRVAGWIKDTTRSATGLGGFTFGETAGLQGHKSTEHNIDLYALFRLVATLTGDASWNAEAEHARAFVRAVWNAEGGHFWTGSDDGASINKAPTQLPLDAQTWSWLSLGDPAYRSALDWARTGLATTDTPLRPNSTLRGAYAVSGVGFSSGTFRTDVDQKVAGKDWNPKPDDAAVWFEGTAQLALALQQRNGSGDRDRSRLLMDQLRSAQDRLGAGQTYHGRRVEGGVVAASSPMDTGFGFDYSQNLHVGATSWYLFAAMRFNPFRF